MCAVRVCECANMPGGFRFPAALVELARFRVRGSGWDRLIAAYAEALADDPDKKLRLQVLDALHRRIERTAYTTVSGGVQCNCYDMHLRRYHPHWESVSKISPSTSSIANQPLPW